jgi:hypothetical protein
MGIANKLRKSYPRIGVGLVFAALVAITFAAFEPGLETWTHPRPWIYLTVMFFAGIMMSGQLSNRVRWIVLLLCTIGMFGLLAKMDFDFAFLMACIRAGGHIGEGFVCVGANTNVTLIGDVPWQRVALALTPYVFAAVAVGVLAWKSWPSKGKK